MDIQDRFLENRIPQDDSVITMKNYKLKIEDSTTIYPLRMRDFEKTDLFEEYVSSCIAFDYGGYFYNYVIDNPDDIDLDIFLDNLPEDERNTITDLFLKGYHKRRRYFIHHNKFIGWIKIGDRMFEFFEPTHMFDIDSFLRKNIDYNHESLKLDLYFES